MRINAVSAIVTLCAGFGALAQPPAIKVVVKQATLIDAPATMTVVGTVQPLRLSRLGAEMGGVVEKLPVRQGDFVESGDVICAFNDDILTLRYEAAKARLASLKARHDELLAGTRKETLERLKALVDEAEADARRWEQELKRVERLYESNDSFAKELYDTRADHARAAFREAAARAAYDEAKAGPRKEEIERVGHDVAEQQAIANQIQRELAKKVIHAPFTGHVTELLTEVGEWVPDGGAVVELVDLSSVLVRIYAPEEILPFLDTGAPARVKVDALKRSFDGTIRHIIRLGQRTGRTFPVEIALDNEDGLLAAGMFARAVVPAGAQEETVAVPKDAVIEKNGIAYAGVITPGRNGPAGMLMPVTVGAEVGDWIAITSGNIQPGMEVIVRGNEWMLPFPMDVIIVDEKGTPIETAQGQGGPPRGASEGN